MSLQRLYHHTDHLEEQLQFSQDPSLSPAAVSQSWQIRGQDCCSSSMPACWCYVDQSLHRQSWVSGNLWTVVVDEDDALELHRKEITKHVEASKTS